MNPRGISVAGILGIVFLAALGLGAIRHASVIWTSLASTLVLGLLLVSVLGAVFLRGPDRAYWTGFARFGIVYLVLANGNWVGGQFGQDLTRGLDEAAGWLLPDPAAVAPAARRNGMELLAQQSTRRGNLVQLLRLSVALGLALAGGLVARSFALPSERARRPRGSEPLTTP